MVEGVDFVEDVEFVDNGGMCSFDYSLLKV